MNELEVITGITLTQLRNKITSLYQPGQIVNMRKRNDKGEIYARFKVKILEFYPYFVLTERRGHKECFTYADFEILTILKKGEKAA